MKKTRRYAEWQEEQIATISLAMASSKDVLEWSHGEVENAETINYKSFKPEKKGLFDELIFGPVLDYRCAVCYKKYRSVNEGEFCTFSDLCREKKSQILSKESRRSRMGHIKLNAPVVHFWYFKIDHSILAKLLGLENNGSLVTRNALESIIYYKSHIVLDNAGLTSLFKNQIIEINQAAVIYRNALFEIRDRYKPESKHYKELTSHIEELESLALSKIGRDYGIDFYEYNEIIEEYTGAKINTGSAAIEYLLDKINLEAEATLLRNQINAINASDLEKRTKNKNGFFKSLEKEKLYKRLQVINAFLSSHQDLKSMLIYNLPVIPADLRPMVQLDGGRHSTSDVNELYRRIIIRNNRLKKWLENDAPQLIVQNELRMVQEAVDALFDNQRKASTKSVVLSKEGRPYKSISDALVGKKGRFRQNLLGKRVDYSGRSVIVVGPELAMHECGIPRQMAAKLFEPFVVRELIKNQVAYSIKGGKKLIEEQNPVIWPHVAKVITDKIVLLNRAPSLHRLSIQAFKPVLVRGKAIKLHPLVTTAFNADFDGDQMAVHVPISKKAVGEAFELMLANKNILGPKDGEPIINPSQDIVLGIYYLTTEKKGALGEGNYYSDFTSLMRAYQNRKVALHARVYLPINSFKKEVGYNKDKFWIFSSVGKFILNQVFPSSFPFIFEGKTDFTVNEYKNYSQDFNLVSWKTDLKQHAKDFPLQEQFTKKTVAWIIRQIFEIYNATVPKSKIAQIIATLNFEDNPDLFKQYDNLIDYYGKKIILEHSQLLTQLTLSSFRKMKAKILSDPAIFDKNFYTEDRVKILDEVWFGYTNFIAEILDKIKNLGFEYSTKSGISISISDIVSIANKDDYLVAGDSYTKKLKQAFEQGLVSDDERYLLVIKKWTEIKDQITAKIENIISEQPKNPLVIMINSGARSNVANFVQLSGMRGLMSNNTKTLKADAENEKVVRSTVEVPIKSSFIDGLTAYEFYSSTHGARKGLTDTALNTAKSGYLTRRLVDVGQNIVVREKDCDTDFGLLAKDIVDNKTGQIIVSFRERIEGRFLVRNLYVKGKLIIDSNTLINLEMAKKIASLGIKELEIRSILGCHTRNGVCKKCYGKDLATNKLVEIGEAVGIIAAQSIGEPGTQLTMRTFQTGGVAGMLDITGGFARLIELIDAYEVPWGKPAIISPINGEVKEIKKLDKENLTGKFLASQYLITLENKKLNLVKKVHVSTQRKLRVQVGDQVKTGQKLSEGPIILKELLNTTDARTVQNYLLKEIQRLYRMQGIEIADKYIEIIIRQLLSKLVIYDPGDSKFFAGAIVDIFTYQRENGKLLMQGKEPAYGKVVIKGAKQTPLLSESFLASASYQETSKILLHAAISNQVDNLEGLKENIIIGKKIPAGTNFDFEPDSKYDIRETESFFNDKVQFLDFEN